MAFFIGFSLLVLSCYSFAELKPLSDQDMAKQIAQAGVELDLDVQVDIDSVRYLDGDGFAINGEPGSAGEIGLYGVHIGSHKGAITTDMVSQERPFAGSELAAIHKVWIDVQDNNGIDITLNELGDNQGNGLDIIINRIGLGLPDSNAGGLLLENISNYLSASTVTELNNLYGTVFTDAPGFKPIHMNVLMGAGISDITGSSGALSFPSLNMNGEFFLHLDKLAWVDDGHEAGIAGLTVFREIDSNGDGIKDKMGGATLSNFSMETVNHTTSSGKEVQALYIENLDFKASIALNNIYIGDPQHSLGSLLIRDIDTAGTALWIYEH
jgi:hypothetical protein